MNADHPELDRYLDEVAAHLGSRQGKKDLVLELRSAILDRVDAVAGGPLDDAAIGRVLAAMGEPAEVALGYMGESYLIGPRYYRPFLVYTALIFAIHVVLILVATVTGSGIEVFPVSVMRVAHPHSFLNLCFVAAQALLLDIGLMVVIFAGVARVQRSVRVPRIVFRVQAGLRPSLTRALLAALAIVILSFFRDQLFIVVTEGRVHPLFTRSFAAALPWLNAFLAVVVAKETAYALLGERRWLVAADSLVGMAGVALMIWFLTRPAFLAFPTTVNEPSPALPTLNQLMMKTMQMIFIIFAVAFALQAGKRAFRFLQIWR